MASHAFSTKFGTARIIVDAPDDCSGVSFLVSIMGVSVAVPLDPNAADALIRDLQEAVTLARHRRLSATANAARRVT